MAYTSGFEYDIFISYSRDDNAVAPGETQGWVSGFKETLEHWLIKRRHLKGLKIWFDDQNLQGNSDFNAVIKSGIEHSALFFILNSKNYQDSEYCKKELAWFFELNEHRPGGIMVGGLMRPFNILLNNIHYDEWPEVLQEKMCFYLHDANPKIKEFGDRPDIGTEEFTKKTHPIIVSTVSTLEALAERNKDLKEPKYKQDNPVSGNKPTVFFADVADTLKPFRERLAREIAAEANVMPMMPPPYEPEPHQQELQGALQQSDLSVHLLDQWGGHPITARAGTTFPRLHADVACATQQKTLIWIPDRLNAEDFEDEAQAEWLHRLEHEYRPEHHYQFVRCSRQNLTDQIRQMLKTLRQQQVTIDGQARFMIDTHQKDQVHAYKLAGLLAEYNIDVGFNKEADNPIDNLDAFDQAVRDVQHLIITFGAVAPGWLKRRIERAMQVKIAQFSQNAESATIWVFLPPGSKTNALPKIPSNMDIYYLRCTNEQISNDVIKPLLNYLPASDEELV